MLVGVIILGLVLSGYVLVASPHIQYWKKLNEFQSDTTIEELLEEKES